MDVGYVGLVGYGALNPEHTNAGAVRSIVSSGLIHHWLILAPEAGVPVPVPVS